MSLTGSDSQLTYLAFRFILFCMNLATAKSRNDSDGIQRLLDLSLGHAGYAEFSVEQGGYSATEFR